MFALKHHPAQLSNLNTRIERHGEERVLAADLKLAASVPSADLDALEPGLKSSLFRKPQQGDQIALIGDPLTAVKHPSLKPVGLTQKFPGYEITVAPLGADEGEGLFLVDVELKGFTVEPREGGSATVTFTASVNVDPDELTDLAEALVREDALVTLVPPKAQAQQGDDTLPAAA